jgi:type III secretory pathway component EscS
VIRQLTSLFRWPADILDDDDRQILGQALVLLLAAGIGLIIAAATVGLAVAVFQEMSAL